MGKGKPLIHHKSFRRVTVVPQPIMCEPTENILCPFESYTLYGFTTGMSYLLAAILRNECETWAVDNKMTLFMVTCDGDSAFDVTDRDIQVRELYENGGDGDM